MDGTVRVQFKDTKEYEIPKRDIMLSDVVKNQLKDYDNSVPFQFPEIDEKTADKVLEYLSHYGGEVPQEIEKPLASGDMKNVTDEWSANFVDKIPLDDLVNLTIAAKYMKINHLLDLCCAKFASICKDKTGDEIFKVFNINETFTEDEKNQMREENKWIEENLI